ncbi:MAG: winged helix-turn-helix domain-containing protein [Chloroflexota bacterium]
MPRTLRLPDGGYMRRHDIQNIIEYLRNMQSVAVTGFSNIGKSSLMRLLSENDVWVQEIGEAGQQIVSIYVDCNRMLDMSDQGFYEVVLRSLKEGEIEQTDLSELNAAYEKLIAPDSEFQIPLSFNQGLTSILQNIPGQLVLLFDEFDEPFDQIDPRVFLNLRALKDRYVNKLVYVTATMDSLTQYRTDEDHCVEFCELFRHRTWHLTPLTRPDTNRHIRRYMQAYEVPFAQEDYDFIYQWTGGHPGMLDGVYRVLEEALESTDQSAMPVERWELHRNVSRQFRLAKDLMYECEKIWSTLSESHQETILLLFKPGEEALAKSLDELYRKHILRKVEGKPKVFSRLLAEYIQRQINHKQPEEVRLWVDTDSGEVLVGGESVETLTHLEYKLMLLLFNNADKIIDKYQIVTNVWGESYIDEVDDARIEKLISRLRQKIEPDPSTPSFLSTVRGRGYRLSLD